MPEANVYGQAGALPKITAGAFVSVLLLLTGCKVHAADPERESQQWIRNAIKANASSAKAPDFARQDFLRQPRIADVKLSPDGRAVSYRQRSEQQTDLLLLDLATGKTQRVLADIRRVETGWSADGQHLWLSDQNGVAIYDRNIGVAKRILKWDEKRHQRFWGSDSQAPGYALLREKKEQDGAWRYRALRIDVNGKTSLLYEAEKPLRGVLLNRDGSLAYTAGYEDARYDTVIRQHTRDGSTELLRCQGAEQCNLLGHNRNHNELWLLSQHDNDTQVLKRWQAGQWHTEHHDPRNLADVAAVLWRNTSNDWLAVAYHPDRRRWHGRDANVTAQLDALQQQLPDAVLDLNSSNDGKRWLVRARHATWAQERYYVYTPEQNQLRRLFATEQAASEVLPAEHLAAAIPLHYHARDGLLVHGYAYLPHGIMPDKAPLVALIHGGPFNRDRDEYLPLVQLLVNRGYAVFTPNFRASTGYGQRYLLAPGGDFGNANVLGDVIDGLDFLLAEGIGDRNKQAVVGHSFGGYASLMAISHYPDRFRVAVASAAPVDFDWVMKEISENGGSALPENGPPGDIFLAHYGLPFGEPALRQKMVRESPLNSVAQLRTPVYLWAGAQDDRVPLKSITRYVGDAKRRNKTVTLLIDPQSGHNPDTEANLEALVYLIESATSRYLGGVTTPPSLALQKLLNKNLRVIDGANATALAK